jgi:hypothetical protein
MNAAQSKTEASRYTVQGRVVEQCGNSRVFLAGHKLPNGSVHVYGAQYQVKENGHWRDSLVPASTKQKLREKVAAKLATGSAA